MRTKLGLGLLAAPAWTKPGIKFFHVADFDYATTCVEFKTCLGQIKSWSDGNPRHVPLLIMLKLEAVAQSGVSSGLAGTIW